MGTSSLTDAIDATIADVSAVNQYGDALRGDHVPRSGGGIAADIAGSLGQTSLQWLKAHIASGYWSAGDIKPHHTYNGAAPIDQGWFPCDGTIINEANYNSVHGAGSWATYVSSSVLDGKYAPDLVDKYLAGASVTTETGAAPIGTIGNSNNEINLNHAHTVSDHTHDIAAHIHQVYDYVGQTSISSVYDSGGNAVDVTVIAGGGGGRHIVATGTSGPDVLSRDMYTTEKALSATGGATPGTDAQLSGAQGIRPETIEVIYYIRII